MGNNTLSAVILSHNDENHIEKALKSVDFCDEILVVDDFSSDHTLKKVNKSKAKLIQRKLDKDFAKQRNFALSQTRGDWVLFVDADEEVSEPLKKEIVKEVNQTDNNERKSAYYIKRRDYWWGRELKFGETAQARNRGIIRLIKKNSGQWENPVHETFASIAQPGRLKSYLNHYPHPKLKDFLTEVNFYSTVRARELAARGKTTNILAITFVPLGKFLYNYFFKLGFLDGARGFGYSFLMSFHSFLVRAKLYQYTKIRKKCG